MDNQSEFNSILTWLGVTLGVITLGAAIFAIFRLTSSPPGQTQLPPISTASSYPCPQVSPKTNNAFDLPFDDRNDAKPNVTLSLTLPTTHVLCHVAIGDATQFRAWKVRQAADYQANSDTREYSIAILRERDGDDVTTRKGKYRQRLEEQKTGTDTVTDYTHKSLPGLVFTYERDGEKQRQHEIMVNKDFTILVWARGDEMPVIDDVLKSLQIKPQ